MKHSPKSELRLTGIADNLIKQNLLSISSTESTIRCNEACGLDTEKHVKHLKMLRVRQIELENVYNKDY